MKQEVASLKHKLAEQEQILQDTVETLKDSNRTKDSMEQFIFGQRESHIHHKLQLS